jgi:pimeloyl-ACP methyl ester carboxylesterase
VTILDVDNASLYYREQGHGSPLVLVHGSATDHSTWDGVADRLAEDHRVITYDRRGYGQSAHKPVRDHRLHAADLRAVLERVAGEPAVVVGWSSGGNIALAVAARHPELLTGLVVVEAPFHGLRHADRSVLATAFRLKLAEFRGQPEPAAEVFLRFGSALRSGGNAYDQSPAALREHLLGYSRQVLAEWDPHPFGVMHEHIRLAAVLGIPVPLTWVLGGESLPWLAGLHARVARRLPGLRTVTIGGAGHLVHIDRPTEFVEVVKQAAQLAGPAWH